MLIGGLYPGQKPEWEYGLKGYTLELAFPVTRANEVLKRIRALFDAETVKGMPMASTYRSGINIKFGKAHFDLLGQVTTGTADGQDWSKGAIMFDFPSFRPSIGDQKRYNEAFCKQSSLSHNSVTELTILCFHLVDINLANTLVDEFPCRPHWTKNTRDVFKRAVKNLDPSVS